MTRSSKNLEDIFSELLADATVSASVKQLLQWEYQAGSPLFEVFVEHSWSVARAAVDLATRCQADVAFVWEASWLHDIGIKYTDAPGIHCTGTEHYLRHGVIGRTLCESRGLYRHGLVCERHVGTGLTALEIQDQALPLPLRDMVCESLEERLICYVDQFFSKSSPVPLSLTQVEPRIKRHGLEPWARFCDMHQQFGHLNPSFPTP